LFDKTGELLKTHLGDVSAEPSATQLIVQFLEHSGLFNTNVVGTTFLRRPHRATYFHYLQPYDHEIQTNLHKKIFFSVQNTVQLLPY